MHDPSPPDEPVSETIPQTGIPQHLLVPEALPSVPGYTLTREIARGGMGAVYAAYDPLFGREVAVKVMHPGQDAGRFVIEARVTARLPHPGIPPVYALGTLPDGRPFLAMKLIQGRTLADELQSARPTDLPRLIGVFEQICQTVGFAHSQNVIHRDLKPANVMVGRFGEVQVMDWGLAKGSVAGASDTEIAVPPGATRREVCETIAGRVAGSPAYMAPEQARAEPVDSRADVFALGGILATILTGRPPFVGDTALSTVLMAAQAELTNCFAQLDACGADPDLIALAKRCLASAVHDRFADGESVAEAVAAYRAGVEERLRRAERERVAAEARAAEEANTRREAEARVAEQRKRRRVQAALAAAVLLLVAGGGIFAWWQERTVGERRARDARNRGALVAALDRCEVALRARDADVAGTALSEAEERLAEGNADDLSPRARRCRADLAMLEELDRIDKFRWTPAGNKLPDHTAIVGRWEKAFTQFGLIPGTTPPADAARLVTESAIQDRLLSALDLWLAFAPSRGLADVLAAADPNEYRNAVRAAVLAGDPSRVRRLAASAAAAEQPSRFAVVWADLSQVPDSRRRALLGAAALTQPGDVVMVMALGTTYPYNQPAGAVERLRWYQAAVAAHPRLGVAWNNLAVALVDRGELAAGVVAYREAIRRDPGDHFTHNNLGTTLKEMGDLEGAIAAYREALRLNPASALTLGNLGNALYEKGDEDGAIAAYREAIHHDPKYIPVYASLGNVLNNRGDTKGAIAAYREALKDKPFARDFPELERALNGPPEKIAAYLAKIRPNPDAARNLCLQGLELLDKKDASGAINAFRDALTHDPKSAPAHFGLGLALTASGEPDRAIAAFRAAVKHESTRAVAHYHLGDALQAQGDYDGAVAAYREAIRHDTNQSLGRTDLYIHLGVALGERGELDAAIDVFKEAIRLNPSNPKCRAALAEAERLKAATASRPQAGPK